MLKKQSLFGFLLLAILMIPKFVDAFCPVCTVAVGAGVGLSRWLKIDDIITGLWIGAFIVSTICWTVNYLNSKNIHFKGRIILISLSYYALIILPLYYSKIIGHPYNRYLGIDKLVFGIIVGSIVFLLSFAFHKYLMKRNHGKVYFLLQKVVIPVVFLLITSGIFYFITK